MKKTYLKVVFLSVLALILIAAAVDVKNSGMKVDNGRLLNPVGTAALPGITFNGDPNTGFSDTAGDTVVLSTNGVARQTCSTTYCTFDLPIVEDINNCGVTYYPGLSLQNHEPATLGNVQYSPSIEMNGSACDTAAACVSTNQSWLFANEPVQGNPTSSVLTFNQRTAAAAYGTRMSLTSGGVLSPIGKMQTAAGTAAAPSIGFIGDTDSGLSAEVLNTPVISAGGNPIGTFSATGLDLNALDLTCNQATATVDAITALTAPSVTTAVASDGILLRNTTNSGTSQLFSPSLRLDGTGYTAGPTLTRQSWAITNKPTSATVGKIAFDFASAGGAYVEKAYIGQYGNFYGLSSVVGHNNSVSMDSLSTGFGIYAVTAGLEGRVSDSSTAIATYLGFSTAAVVEGARITKFGHVPKANVDKDGVYWQGYGSGQTAAAGTLVKTLVTTADDDTLYKIKYSCLGVDQGADPTYYHAAEHVATFIRTTGGGLSLINDTATYAQNSGGGTACTGGCVASASTLAIIVTATGCAAGAGTMNWKVFGEQIEKVPNAATASFAGVAYPYAN